MSATYTLEKDPDGKFVFTFKTHSGEVILTSPGYSDKDLAMRRVDMARTFGRRGESYQLLTAEDGQAYFVLKTTREEVLGQSEMYRDSESVLQGIRLARSNARGARLEDLTVPPPPPKPRRTW